MDRFKVTLIDPTQAQDREDSTFDVYVHAEDADEAADKAMIDERCGVYVTAVAIAVA